MEVKPKTKGQVRVGRCTYVDGKRIDPHFSNFTPIVVLTKSSEYGALGPYVLRDGRGRIVENKWQAWKVYEWVPEVSQTEHRYSSKVVWKHKREIHAKWDEKNQKCDVLPAYLLWRQKLENCEYPIRYPVGYEHRHKCLFSLDERDDFTIDPTPLTYIEARKAIYIKCYEEAVREVPLFQKLKERLEGGENLLIIEVDGPHEETMPYYIQKYNVPNNFITNGTMLATKENLQIMVNDEKHPYGHGYCLAALLLDIKVE